MDATKSATPPTTSAHADGRSLLAVAEGDAQNPPSDAVVAHIFSCEQCSTHVRDLRTGLAGLASVSKPAATRATAARTKTATIATPDAESFDVDTAGDAELALLDDEEATIERARMLVWKLALVGGVLAVALCFARFFASSLH